MIPYFFVGTDEVMKGLCISVAVMVVALWVFGYVKTCVVEGWGGLENVEKGCRGGVQMVAVGGLAAGAAMGLVKGFNELGEGV